MGTVRCLAFMLGMLLARPASAFCGLYVSGADTKLYNDATQVVLMREGLRTVISMQNHYKGPPEAFAMVVPVPVVLQKDNVRTLDPAVFDRLDQLTAPRLVEYWERDPCGEEHVSDLGLGVYPGPPRPDTEQESALPKHVRVEAQFIVGEYDVVVLGADDSLALDDWLHGHGYQIPQGAEPYLRPYVARGSHFFVAKVDISKVQLKDGRAKLSPLRFHYDSESFELPVRLGLVNSSGTQDLIVQILARNRRYEVADYPNVTIPTNLDVAPSVRDDFGSFYTALFDATLAKNPGAVVTEYAWAAAFCDPCPTQPLEPGDIDTLGGDVLPPDVHTAAQVFQNQTKPAVEACLGRAHPRVGYAITVSASGAVTDVVLEDKDPAYTPPMASCVETALRSTRYDPPGLEARMGVWLGQSEGVRFYTSKAFDSSTIVVTRLHTRYAKEQLGRDLVFREAPGIEGGRENRHTHGALSQDAEPTTDGRNWFQGRYVIRHRWRGEVTCQHPVYGVWGPPPDAEAGAAPPAPVAGRDLAFSPRGSVVLASVVGEVPALGLHGSFKGDARRGPPLRGSTWMLIGVALGVLVAAAYGWRMRRGAVR